MLIVKKISISCDFWTDRSLRSYLCVTGHYVTHEFDSKSMVLSFNAFCDRHQGVRMAKIIKEKLINLGLFNKLQCITSDGAGNMLTMHKALKDDTCTSEWIWCVAHRLHLVILNGFLLWSRKKKKKDNKNILDDDNNNVTMADMNSNDDKHVITAIIDVENDEESDFIWDSATDGKI